MRRVLRGVEGEEGEGVDENGEGGNRYGYERRTSVGRQGVIGDEIAVGRENTDPEEEDADDEEDEGEKEGETKE